LRLLAVTGGLENINRAMKQYSQKAPLGSGRGLRCALPSLTSFARPVLGVSRLPGAKRPFQSHPMLFDQPVWVGLNGSGLSACQ